MFNLRNKWLPFIFIFALLSTNLSAYEVAKTSSGELSWSVPSVAFYINASGGPQGSPDAIQAAMQTWTAVSSSFFSFAYAGPTDADLSANDGVNTIAFMSGSWDFYGQVAASHMMYDPNTNKMQECDILFNTDYLLSTDGSQNAWDVQTVALHELGHCLNLEDVLDDPNKVMYYASSAGEIRHSLSQDDIDGMVHLYPLSSCTYSLSPSDATASARGGTGSVSVTPVSDKCVWSAVSNSPWINITSGNSGTGNGTVSYSVSANPDTMSRSGTLSAAGKTFTITQSGVQVEQYSASLNAGWNFVSVPLDPIDPAITDIMKDISTNLKIVWGYDNLNKVWLRYAPGSSIMAPNALSKVEGGKGYWIYMNDAAPLALGGLPASSQAIQLYTGWNLIGYNGTDGASVSDALSNVSNDWLIAWSWDNGYWKAAISNSAFSQAFIPQLSAFTRGKAYWIKTKSN